MHSISFAAPGQTACGSSPPSGQHLEGIMGYHIDATPGPGPRARCPVAHSVQGTLTQSHGRLRLGGRAGGLRQVGENGTLRVEYCPLHTQDMWADGGVCALSKTCGYLLTPPQGLLRGSPMSLAHLLLLDALRPNPPPLAFNLKHSGRRVGCLRPRLHCTRLPREVT